MQLSKRLQAVTDFVSEGHRVADIGCDHGYIAIYLTKHKIAKSVIAMDVNKGPLQRAKENILRYGCEGKIETRLSDGAFELKKGEVDTILIAGMGGILMIKILSEAKETIQELKELVLQPQSEIEGVRRYLHQIGFRIEKETMLEEDKKYYTVIKAIKGKEQYQTEEEYRFGKYLLDERNPYLKEFLEFGEKKYKQILENLNKHGSEHTKERYQELTKEYEYIKNALRYYDVS